MMTAMERRAAREAATIKASGMKVAKMKAEKHEKATVKSLADEIEAVKARLNEVIDAMKAANVAE